MSNTVRERKQSSRHRSITQYQSKLNRQCPNQIKRGRTSQDLLSLPRWSKGRHMVLIVGQDMMGKTPTKEVRPMETKWQKEIEKHHLQSVIKLLNPTEQVSSLLSRKILQSQIWLKDRTLRWRQAAHLRKPSIWWLVSSYRLEVARHEAHLVRIKLR